MESEGHKEKELKEAQNKLENLHLMEEEFWQIRSRSNWIKQGDKNTKYFHHHVSQRERKKRITELEDEEGLIARK